MCANHDRPSESIDFMKKGRSHAGPDSPRSKEEIKAALAAVEEKVWLDRHRMFLDREETNGGAIDPKIKAIAEADPKSIESTYSALELGPYSDFEWGMLNGKLSALRWVLGSDWDFLDT